MGTTPISVTEEQIPHNSPYKSDSELMMLIRVVSFRDPYAVGDNDTVSKTILPLADRYAIGQYDTSSTRDILSAPFC